MALGDVPEDFADFFLMKQEFTGPLGLYIKVTGLPVGLDMQIIEENFLMLGQRVAVFKVDIPFPDGFNLGTAQGDAALPRSGEMVIPKSLFVGSNHAGHNRLIIATTVLGGNGFHEA